MGLDRHVQSTENSCHIFVISPENAGNEGDFLAADKHKTVLQVGIIIFGVRSQTIRKYVCISLKSLQKSVGYEVDFLTAD